MSGGFNPMMMGGGMGGYPGMDEMDPSGMGGYPGVYGPPGGL